MVSLNLGILTTSTPGGIVALVLLLEIDSGKLVLDFVGSGAFIKSVMSSPAFPKIAIIESTGTACFSCTPI